MGVPRPISPEQRLVRGRGCPPPLTCSPGLIPIHHVGDGNMASGIMCRTHRPRQWRHCCALVDRVRAPLPEATSLTGIDDTGRLPAVR